MDLCRHPNMLRAATGELGGAHVPDADHAGQGPSGSLVVTPLARLGAGWGWRLRSGWDFRGEVTLCPAVFCCWTVLR